MAYANKYYDRSPEIMAAGCVMKDSGKMKALLNWDHLIKPADDDVVARKQQLKERRRAAPLVCPEPFDSLKRFEGVCNEMRYVVSPPLGTHFQQVKDNILEGFYNDSHWHKPLGKSRHARHLPDGFNIVEHTLGQPSHKDEDAGKAINPPKLAGQVLFEDSIGRDAYLKSHKSYGPGEQLTRNYGPSFNKNDRFGAKPKRDMLGTDMADCLKWCTNEPFTISSHTQSDNNAHGPQVGKHLLREDILGNVVPKNHTFGAPLIPNEATTLELLHYTGPCYEKRCELAYMNHINPVRQQLKKNQKFKWLDFLARFRHYDKEHTGFLPLPKIFEVCLQFHINLEQDLIELLLLRLTFMSAETKCVDYMKFYELINPAFEFPDFPDKVEDVPENRWPMCSIYNTCYSHPENTDTIPRAGIPSVRNDLPYVQAAINALKDSLGDETEVATLTSPNFYTRNGVSHRDLLKPRTLEELRPIFNYALNLEVPEEAFARLYQEGLKIDQTGGVSIQTLRNLMERITDRDFNWVIS